MVFSEQLGTVWIILRASGVVLEPSCGRLGNFLGPSMGARRVSLGRLGDMLEAFDAILGCLGSSNGRKMKHSTLHVVFK